MVTIEIIIVTIAIIMGLGASEVGSVPCARKVAGSNPT